MKKYKYLVIEERGGYEDNILTIVDSLMDAEELVLSCAEAEVYETFCYLVYSDTACFKNASQYFESVREDFEDLNYETYYGFVLNEPLNYYEIVKVPYLED